MQTSQDSPQRFLKRKPFLKDRRKVPIGYLKISSNDEKTIECIKKLKKAGCRWIYKDIDAGEIEESKASSELSKAIKSLKNGDLLIINELSDLSSDQDTVIYLLQNLVKNNIHIKTIDGSLNTIQMGQLASSFLSLIYQLSKLNREKQVQGKLYSINKEIAVKRNVGGRPKTNKNKADLVIRLRVEGYSYRSIRGQTGLALSTIRRIILDQ